MEFKTRIESENHYENISAALFGHMLLGVMAVGHVGDLQNTLKIVLLFPAVDCPRDQIYTSPVPLSHINPIIIIQTKRLMMRGLMMRVQSWT